MQKLNNVKATKLKVGDVLDIAGTPMRITSLSLDFGRGHNDRVRLSLRETKGTTHFSNFGTCAKKTFNVKRPKKK